MLLIGWLGYRHVELSAKVLAVLLACEMGIVLLLSFVILAQGGADGIDFKTFTPQAFLEGSPALGIMFAAASFVGFEATAVFRDEAVEPNKTVPRATYAAIIIITLFYVFANWSFIIGWGSDNAVAIAATSPSFLFDTTDHYLGPIGTLFAHIFVITGCFACVLSFHNIITRYVHSLSRVEVFPAALAQVSTRDGAPSRASLATSAVTVLLVLLAFLLGLDPYLEVFTWLVGLGGLIYLLLLLACNVAVIAYFARNREQKASMVKTMVSSALSLLGLGLSVWLTVINFPLLVGDVDDMGEPVFGGLSIGLMLALLVVVIIGVVHTLVLKAKNPSTYSDLNHADLAG